MAVIVGVFVVLRMVMVVLMSMVMMIMRFAVAVHVRVERAEQNEHRDDADQDASASLGRGTDLVQRMRQQVQHRDPQHQPGDKAHQKLSSQVGHPHQRWQPSTTDRGRDDEYAVHREQGFGDKQGNCRSGVRTRRNVSIYAFA